MTVVKTAAAKKLNPSVWVSAYDKDVFDFSFIKKLLGVKSPTVLMTTAAKGIKSRATGLTFLLGFED